MIDILVEPAFIVSTDSDKAKRDGLCSLFESKQGCGYGLAWSIDYSEMIERLPITNRQVISAYRRNYKSPVLKHRDTFNICEVSPDSFSKEKNYIYLQELFAFYFSEEAQSIQPYLLVDEDKETPREFSLDGETKSPQNILDPSEIPKDEECQPTYEEIIEWFEKTYNDKAIMLGRAKRELKCSQYEKPKLVKDCLELLAECYGKVSREVFLDKCHTIDPSLDEARSISDNQAGIYKYKYYVDYNGKKCKLDRHLRKGKDSNPSQTLRIYFFQDDDGKVVIGSLTEHLPTWQS